MNEARRIPLLLLVIYLGQTSASVILPNRNDDVPLAQVPLQSVINWSYPVPDPEQVPECVEGASWMEDCNSCFCSNGHAACTLKLCQPVQVPECVDGESWAEDCNTCYCFNGHAGCTLMLCEPEPVPVCEEGSSWMEDCNSCYCSNGRAVCTLKLCLPEPECVEGSSWMEDCNTCFCSNGRAGCTEMFCLPEPDILPTECVFPFTFEGVEYNECAPGTTQPHPWCATRLGSDGKSVADWEICNDPECVSGERWEEDCNTCHCVNGHAECTLIICEPEPDPECVSGERWEEGCNTCHCVNGHAECTFIICEPEPVSECVEGSSWIEYGDNVTCINGHKHLIPGDKNIPLFEPSPLVDESHLLTPPISMVIPRELDGCYRDMNGKLVRDTYVDSCQKCDYCEDSCEKFNHKTCKCQKKFKCRN